MRYIYDDSHAKANFNYCPIATINLSIDSITLF